MADKRIDPDTAAASARELLKRSVEERVAAVRVLVAATNDVDTADQAAKDSREAHTKAWDAALASGWSEKELRATGARAPGTIGTTLRARRSPRRKEETSAPASEHNE